MHRLRVGRRAGTSPEDDASGMRVAIEPAIRALPSRYLAASQVLSA